MKVPVPETNVAIKRVYEDPSDEDGIRVLVDRLWPRGVSHARGAVDIWLKDVAPSSELRKWFAHDPSRWEEFRKRYLDELRLNAERVGELVSMAENGRITLLYATRDSVANSAAILREFILAVTTR